MTLDSGHLLARVIALAIGTVRVLDALGVHDAEAGLLFPSIALPDRANRPTYRAMNQFGHWFDATLNAGAFKTMPNNPTRPDGVVHQYCPPEHVYSELDHLLSWYGEYTSQPDAYHPLLVAAWLHHRFVRIHPFQDGNGRVTRALVTCHLVERDHLPIVVTRDDRNDYVDTLEAPDDGDLNPTVEFTSRLHRGSMLQAMSACVLPRED